MLACIAFLAAHAAPATVLDHSLEVSIDSRARLNTTQTWVVRIDDPSAVEAGLPAPPGLDGASDNGSLVVESLFLVPEGVPAGTVYTLKATRSADKGSHSGVFEGAAGLPVESARVVVRAPTRSPLTVWADPSADALWSASSGKSATLTWNDVEEDGTIAAVYATWPSWVDAGAELERMVDGKLGTKADLGRSLAQGLKSTSLSELIRRVTAEVAIDRDAIGGWSEARKASEIAVTGKGTPAERAIVLISVLRLAGFEAIPGGFRPASEGTFPVTVPGPALLEHPVIRVRDGEGQLFWVDPANDTVAAPTQPRVLRGAMVWAAGDLPLVLDAGGAQAGSVTLTTAVNLAPGGGLRWNTDVVAEGAAAEAIRELLHGQDEAGRAAAFERLVRQGRPDVDRMAVQTSGTEDPYRQLKIVVSGADEKVFEPFAGGFRGELVPVLAPALAGWLPSNIEIHETVSMNNPQTMVLLGTGSLSSTVSPDAMVERRFERTGPRVQLEVEAIKPHRVATAEREGRALAFFESEADQGIELIWAPPASASLQKQLSSEGTPAEGQALQALMWWSAHRDKKARSIIKKGLGDVSAEDRIAAFERWNRPEMDQVWDALFDLEPTPEGRLAIVEAALASGSDAWVDSHAPQLFGGGADHDAQLWRMLAAVRTGDAGIDQTLAELEGQSEASATATLETRGFLALRQGRAPDVEGLPKDTARQRALHLVVSSGSLPLQTVEERVDGLRVEAGDDAEVMWAASHALVNAGLHQSAAETALYAARLAHDDAAVWAWCGQVAMLAGRLPLALDATERASDLTPDDSVLAQTLHQLATLAHDRRVELEARKRSHSPPPTEWPPSVDALLGIAAPEHLLAVLQYHDDAVLDSPSALAMRAQLRLDAGLLDAAARDAITLWRRHADPQGPALAFAATVGRVQGHAVLELMESADDELAQLTRMDLALITASSDPRLDARELKGQPRAEDLLLAAGNPMAAVQRTKDWPELSGGGASAPRGYRTNAILSGPPGVQGFSHPDRQVAVMVVSGDVTQLPPPLSLFYRIDEPALSTADSVTLMRLVDGYLPLYAARTAANGKTLWGFGFTPSAARRALADLQ